MPTPTSPRSSAPFFRTAPAVCDSGSAKNGCVRPPSGAPACENGVFSPLALRPEIVRAAHRRGPRWLFEPGGRNRPCQRRGSPLGDLAPADVPPRFDPGLAPAASRRASVRRWRLSTAGFHARRPARCACSHFFPRSVGLGPTASCAKGALTIAPSMLCQAQAIPSRSSYSASPLRHSRTNTPLRFHSRKYWWMELAAPYRSSGNAFHWHPVRNTYTMPANTFRMSSGLRPPPGFRRYFRPLARFLRGISGSTLAHISSDTVHTFIALMPKHSSEKPQNGQYINYG